MGQYSIDESIEKIHSLNPWYQSDGLETNGRPPRPKVSGVNVVGYLRDESGLGEAARGYIHALRSLDMPMAFADVSTLSSNRSEDRTLDISGNGHPYEVNLLCIDAGQHFAIMHHLGEENFENRYNIGVWAWELPRFPRKWYDRFAYYDEIWVATSFIVNTLAPISPIPIVRIPPVLTLQARGSREKGRRRLGVRAEEFIYLFAFDFHSHLARKNPLALIDAFRLAFTPSDPVRLVIKCVNAESDPAGHAAMVARAAGHAVAIHNGYWPAQEVRDLMAACDSYVSLHRSEGTGLTITEAMALGKPVIATAWSGNVDFMNVSNSFPVRYRLVELQENVGPYHAGEVWADPSVEHAAERMRFVFEHRQEALARGQAAREEIETNYSPRKVASLIQHRLDVIASRGRFRAFKEEMRAFVRGYRHLTGEIREIVRAVVPAGERVIVVSKGDEQLVSLDDRPGWHFPQGTDGLYAGYYPADSGEAIEHLEALRARGGSYLLFPGTAFWWLDHYEEFRRHLDTYYHRIWQDERCVLFDLA